MTNKGLSKEQKQAELVKYRELVLAALDFYIEMFQKPIQTQYGVRDRTKHYRELKLKAEEQFQKGRLTVLKQWFRDITEIPIESRNLKFNQFLREKTNYDIDIFKSFHLHIDKIIEKGKITSDNQFYDVTIAINYLCQSEGVDQEKIKILDKIRSEYEQRRPPSP
jgi:hypothetical protein